MDKTEYRIKLDKLTSLVEKQDFRGALTVVDGIDWRRVKSVRTLSMVADVYEVNKKYKRCKEILLLARDRSMIGKMVLYRLVEISLKMGDLDDATAYYAKFVEAAPNDNSKFILKYKIYKAQKAPLEDQIAVLEDYKDREYTERWTYELAKLYSQTGQQNRCVEICDDLILWFAEGKYVIKSMELKMQYEPLSSSQRRKYDASVQGKRGSAALRPLSFAPREEAADGRKRPRESTEELLQRMDDAGAAITQEASSARAQMEQNAGEDKSEQAPVNSPEFLGKTVDLREQLAKSIQEVFAGMKSVPESGHDENKPALPGDTGEIPVQNLEPERLEAPADLNTEGRKTILTKVGPEKAELADKASDREADPVSGHLDLDALLKETADSLSEELASGTFDGASTDDATKPFVTVRESAEDATREILTKNIRSETRRSVPPGDTLPMSVEEVLREETPEEQRLRILNQDKPEKFSDHQKKIFSYFAKVPGMDQQVLEALSGVYCHVTEKTSKHGNVAVMGGYGTGKTRLSESIIRAICKDLGLAAVKYAQIDAADLNKKDPAAVVSKMSGGFFLIERAGLLYPDVIKKFNKALEFRTDSMIVIIEDEKTSMRGMLRNNPEFASKFDTVISIPVFTNDELVTFARTYARENGCKMDEMGVLALYTLIGDNQTENEPMTITKVKEIVDKAIKRAGKGTRRFGRKISGKRTDDKERVILYEKDFDF